MRAVSQRSIASFTASGCSIISMWPASIVASLRSAQSARIGSASRLRTVSHTVSQAPCRNSAGSDRRPKSAARLA